MKIIQRSNYIVYFDNVRVDQYLISWNAQNGLFANNASANITLFRTDAMDNWKAYLTQVKIFGENPFTKKFCLLFDGEIMNRSWNENRSNMGKVTFQAKGFYHWLDIPVPLAIQSTDENDPLLRFIYEAQNIDIDAVRTLITSNSETLMKDKNIEEIINQLFEKLTVGYYDVAGEDTAFAFAKVKERFKVMVDVLPEFRESGFLDLFTFTKTTQIESFYVFLNEVLTQLMFEFYQDRDGTFRIKTPSWSEQVMKAHIIDSSIVAGISGLDDWENEPTRVLAIGAETQYIASMKQQGINVDQNSVSISIPVGLYIGDPRNPEEEEYYSTQLEKYLQNFGVSPLGYGEGGFVSSESWFDNTSSYTINSHYGFRKHPITGENKLHAGTDFNLKYEPVYNIGTNGTVVAQGYHATMGNYVTIQQNIGGTNYSFRYMHFQDAASVKVGDKVSPGQRIGTSGNSGGSTGPHLHFEIWKGSAGSGQSVDPMVFLENQKALQTSTPAIDMGVEEYTGRNSSAASKSWMNFEMTHYIATCPGCIGITKAGWNVKDTSIDHRVIAVDTKVVPLNSIVEIEGYGYYNAVDTGGAIKGNILDRLVATYSEATRLGRKNVKLRIVRSGKGDGSIVPPVPYGTPSVGWNGASTTTTTSGAYSSPFANVDGVKAKISSLQQKKWNQELYSTTEKVKASNEEAKPVTYSTKDKTTVPAYSKEFEKSVNNNTGGISPALISAIIETSSNWRENSSSPSNVGLMGIPRSYAEQVLPNQNLLDGNNSINFGSDFLKAAMERFNGKVTFALAAYHLGSLTAVEEITKKTGTLDFSKSRSAFDTATLAFIDKVVASYVGDRGTYITGDPHKDFGSVKLKPNGPQEITDDGTIANAQSYENDIPDYENSFRPKMSEEEKKYKVNLLRVEQALIRADSPALAANPMSADKLIYQYAKYNMQLHRARTHNINIALTTCLPFIRPGFNAWIEPTRTDVMCYITGISHQGSFQDGCTTSLNGGFVRSPDSYRDVDSSIFIGETRASSEVFGELLPDTEMKKIRNELSAMHDKMLVAEAQEFTVLNKLYSSMNQDNDYSTQWNRELTEEEITVKMKEVFRLAPSLVLERCSETATAIEKSKDIFIEKLLFTQH